MDSTVIAEKIGRDPRFDPKIMGMRSAEVKELRSSNPALATTSTTATISHDPVRSHDAMRSRDAMRELHSSSTNISSMPQQSLHAHHKRFSASALALHSNNMYTSSRAASSATIMPPSHLAQEWSRSLKNLSHLNYKSLDKDDRAILTWLTGVVGYRITDYSMLYDGVVLCQLINTLQPNTIDVEFYRDKTPAERLQIAFFSIKEHLNINGPPASIESIIEGKQDDLLFLYLEKIKLFYCTSYGLNVNPRMYSSAKSLNRSHSLSAADGNRPLRDYRSQTSSPYPPALYANNSCTSLESIKERSSGDRKALRKLRPHSYHELSATLMSSSGARVISVETGSASEPEDNSNVVQASVTASANSDSPAVDNNSATKLLNAVVPKPSGLYKTTSTSSTSEQASTNTIGSVTPDQANTSNTKLRDSIESWKCATPNMTPPRHQLPPLPKVPPPPPPTVASVTRQRMRQMESTDGGKPSLQALLSLSQSGWHLTAATSDRCTETQAKFENIIRRERELILYPLQKAFKLEKKKRICLEQKYRKAVATAKRKIDHYEQCIDDLSERITSLTEQVESQQKLADQRLAELSKQVSSYRDEIMCNASMPATTQQQDTYSPTPTDDVVHNKKTFRLFRKTTKKKPGKDKADSRVLQTTSLKTFPAKEYTEHVENLNSFLHKLGYSYLIEKFISNDIGLKELAAMDEAHMQSIGIPMGPRLRILQEIQH